MTAADPFRAALEPRRRAFAIGLSPLGPAWLAPDARRDAELALKRRLWREAPAEVFAAEPAAAAAQAEAAAMIAAAIGAPTTDQTAPPLQRAALTVQDDLVLMARDGPEAPFRMVAASVSFPTHWSLAAKFGKPIADIHAPVPGFARGARNAAVVDRIFAAMTPAQPLERYNWSIHADRALRRPFSHGAEEASALLIAPCLRVERQTLRKLPESGALLFTIRIHVEALDVLLAQAGGAALASRLADALEALSRTEAAYRGVSAARSALVARLRAAAAAGA